jgi:hypothetical protein
MPFLTSRMLRLALIVALTALGGCAWSAKAKQAQHQAQIHRQQDAEADERNTPSKADNQLHKQQLERQNRLRSLEQDMAARADADSLTVAALLDRALAGQATTPASLQLAARAVAAASDRADLALVQLRLCASDPTCDAAPLEARLSQLDPDNGIPWTYALLRAEQANDNRAWRAARAGLAQTRRVSLNWNQTVARLAAAGAGHAGFDATDLTIELTGVAAALGHALQPISRACSPQSIQDPPVLEQCRGIAQALRQSDSMLIEAFGSTLALRLWPEDSAQARAIQVERRTLSYRADLMARNTTLLNSAAATRALAGYLVQYPTEQGAFRALLLKLGLVADPPPDWQEPPAGSNR